MISPINILMSINSARVSMPFMIVDQATKVHAGYARYFTPPPLELAQNINPAIFDGTTNAAEIDAKFTYQGRTFQLL